MAGFATTPGELTPEILTDYLRAAGLLTDGRVRAVDHEIIGTGKMGDNARLSLVYEGDAGTAPRTLVAKLPATDDRTREIAGSMGAYYNEVMFYRELADGTAMRTPAIFASELSPDRSSFLLLMEDLSPAQPGNALVGESRQHAEVALAQVALLAAAYHDDTTLGALDHVLSSDDGGELSQAILEASWPGFVDRFGHGIEGERLAFAERYLPDHTRFVRRYEGPRTLTHGDFRNENILFDGDSAATVDWQTPGLSSPLTDAAYFLGGSLTIDDRRQWERDLVGHYRDRLAEAGVELAADHCWDLYREYAMHGIIITVLGASFTAPDPRGDEMFLTMIQRHLQHCVDLGAAEFLT